ncbi:MAG TPA: TolC family protein [Aequorivita sp.]|uniref:TolC family protein n=1 Tax=Maribacter stanieri TaxID=440514 RepID=UPI000B654CA6|nr:MAG: TolC family protein [Muricauda sp. TMED12]HNP69116.1 TolC family protein [Aequorivita sp.]|tara:strand:+ start:5006 stop:6304 length:1299 start_codon:yes stop_codon:yes gene_type:complete
MMLQKRYKTVIKVFICGFVLLQGTNNLFAQQQLTLAESKELALKNNNRIGKAKEDVIATQSDKRIADVAGRPKLDASATAFYFGEPLNTMLPEYGLAPMVSVTQPIYTGGKIKYGKQMAETNIQMSNAQQRLVEDEVLLATETAYWLVVQAKEEIKLEQQVKKQLASHYTFLNNQFEAGLIYKNDVLRAKVLQNENEARLQAAENKLILAKRRWSQLIGMEDPTVIDVADTLSTGDFSNQGILQNTDAVRPEIDLAANAVKIGELTKSMLKADLKPTVGLALNGVAAFGKEGINFGDPTKKHMLTYFGMLSVNIPVFDWGSKREKVKQQEATIRSAEYGLKELKSQINVEVEQATLNLQLQTKNIDLMQASLTEADENLKLSNDRFKAGTITGEDVLIAETLWQRAYSNMLDAKVRYKIAEAVYRKAIGQIK